MGEQKLFDDAAEESHGLDSLAAVRLVAPFAV